MEFKDLQVGTWCLLDGQKAVVYQRRMPGEHVFVATFPAGLPGPDPDGVVDPYAGSLRHGPLAPSDLKPYQPPDHDEWLAHKPDERRALLPN